VSEQIAVPAFDKLPLSVLHTIWEKTGTDLISETSMGRRLAVWAYYVRHGQDPAFTMEAAEALTLDDFDFTADTKPANGAAPDPTSPSRPRSRSRSESAQSTSAT